MSESSTPEFSLIIASAVHDMKNSLGMLIHSVDDLCESLPEEQKQNLDLTTIKYEAERVNNDLIQLLGLYRLQKSKLSAHIDEHHLDDILAEQRAQYSEIFSPKGVELEVRTDVNLSWYFDRELIQGILNNALNNAIRYTNDKVLICAQLEAVNDHEYLSVCVHDNGKGYPKSLLEADPCAINNNINFKTGSTSLGLYFAAMVAKLHNEGDLLGQIKLENDSELGGGVFKLLLP